MIGSNINIPVSHYSYSNSTFHWHLTGFALQAGFQLELCNSKHRLCTCLHLFLYSSEIFILFLLGRVMYSGIWSRVVRRKSAEVPEEYVASIFRPKKKPSNKPMWKHVANRALLSRWLLVWLILQTWRWMRYLSPKRWLIFRRSTWRYVSKDRTRNLRWGNLKSCSFLLIR
jgi:hypothetical protein